MDQTQWKYKVCVLMYRKLKIVSPSSMLGVYAKQEATKILLNITKHPIHKYIYKNIHMSYKNIYIRITHRLDTLHQ